MVESDLRGERVQRRTISLLEMMLRRNNMKENIEGKGFQIIQGPPGNIKSWIAWSHIEVRRTYISWVVL